MRVESPENCPLRLSVLEPSSPSLVRAEVQADPLMVARPPTSVSCVFVVMLDLRASKSPALSLNVKIFYGL